MARGINKVILLGNVGSDPEVRYTSSGVAVANFSVATSETYKDRDGNVVEKTEWHRCVAWARLAEIVGDYVKKGRQLYVEGQIQTQQYEDKDGVTKYSTEIKVREMQMLGGKSEDTSDGAYEDAPEASPAPAPRVKKAAKTSTGGTPTPDDDLPF